MDLKKRYIDKTNTDEDGLIIKTGSTVYIAGESAEWNDEVENNFKYLKKKLFDNEREIHYLDLYNISEYYIDDNESLAALFGSLIENTAIGIGVTSVNFLGDTYKRGDLLLKMNNGQPLRIEAPSSGMYYPVLEYNSGNWSITWTYTEEDSPLEEEDPKGTYAQEIETWDSDNNIYGIVFTKPTEGWVKINFAIKTYTEGEETISILPIIKCFNDNYEEVYCDFSILVDSENNSLWALTIPATNSYITKIVVK